MADDVSWFLELAEELALFGKITLRDPETATVPLWIHIFIPGDELLALQAGSVSQNSNLFRKGKLALICKLCIFSLRDVDSGDVTPFPYITGAGQLDEDRLGQPTSDTASFNFME